MRKTVLLFAFTAVMFAFLLSCSKEGTPLAPKATSTPNAAQIAVGAMMYTSLVSVPGATFTQSNSAESFSHNISPFLIGEYEVTYELWHEVRQWALNNGYVFANAGSEGTSGVSGAAPTEAKHRPVTMVNWRDAIVWCNAYSELMRRRPVYCSDTNLNMAIKDSTDRPNEYTLDLTPGSLDNPFVNWNGNGYRLPSEGEWELAARYIDASTFTPYNYAAGDEAPCSSSATLGNFCWYSANSGNTANDVGGKMPNGLGIYDMSGNVREWCWDWYGPYPGTSNNYRRSEVFDLYYRIYRGGDYDCPQSTMQTGLRNYHVPSSEFNVVGLRVARTL